MKQVESDELEVLYVLLAYPVRSERFIIREIRKMRQLGVSLRVVTIGAERGAGADPSDPGLPVWQRPRWWAALQWGSAVLRGMTRPRALARLLIAAFALAPEEARWGRVRALRWAIVALHFADRLRSQKPIVIHAHFATAPASVALLLGSWLGRPWGFSVHARDLYADRVDFEKKVSRAQHVLTCSEVAAEDLRCKLPTHLRNRVHTVHHGVDLTAWSSRAGSADRDAVPLILGVGRFEPKKGFSVLVEACGTLRDEGFALRCELIGDGSERESLVAEIGARQLTASVRIVPWCSPAVLKEHYARASALAVASVIAVDGDRDNLPNAVIEALASGVPVVASDLPAIAGELGPSDSACLVPAGNATALASALRAVCSDRELSRRLASNGRRLAAQRFDLSANVRRVRDLLSGSATDEWTE